MSFQSRTSAPALPPLLKHLNERTVLEAIRASAPISRAEISRRAGISKPTVSLALQSLLDAGLVREASDEPDGPRYGAVFFEPVPEAALVLGLDLGGRFLRGAICDLRGDVRARLDVEIDGERRAGACSTRSRTCGPRSSTATGLDEALINGAVVGVPGVVDAERRQDRARDERGGSRGRHVRRRSSSDRLELPVWLENDVNLAALGEQWQGVARGVDDFLFLSIGTGMGAGLVLRGDLHRGLQRRRGRGRLRVRRPVARRRSVRRRGRPPTRPRWSPSAARRPRWQRRSSRARSSPPRAPGTRSRPRSSRRSPGASLSTSSRSRR